MYQKTKQKQPSALFRVRQKYLMLVHPPTRCVKKAQKTIPKTPSFVFLFFRASIYLSFLKAWHFAQHHSDWLHNGNN